MNLVHAYHVYAAGRWQDPLAEHLYALDKASFTGPTILGLVGAPEDREQARAAFTGLLPDAQVVEAEQGWEQVTLAAVHAHARQHPGAVLYAHTKGAAHPGGWQDRWRRSLTWDLIRQWPRALALLETHDAVGSHWLTPEDWDSVGHPGVITPHFAGNYWMARTDYLRRLPACSTQDRWDAERWIGLRAPRIHDLRPGWPHETCQAPLGAGRLIVPTKGGSRCG